MTLSLAARLTAALTAVVIALTLLTVTLMGVSLRSRVESEMASALTRDATRWKALKDQELRVLAELGRVAAANPAFTAAFAEDHSETDALLNEHRTVLGVDLMALVGVDGTVLASSGERTLPGIDKVVRQQGQVLLPATGVPLLAVGQPLQSNGVPVGYLVVGAELGGEDLRRLGEGNEDLEALLHAGPRLVARSVHAVQAKALLAAASASRANGAEVNVGGVSLHVSRVEVGEGLELVLARGAQAEWALMRATLMEVLGLGLFVALVAGGGMFLLVRRMMAPLGALTAAAARVVAEGDFSGTLDIHSRDEIGQLATSFGDMMARLRAVLMALKNSAQELEATALELANSASDQNLAVTRQAAALHQTQIAARQLQESSRAAAQRATGVLREAEKAGAVGQAGESAVAGSVGGLTHIRSQVERISNTVSELRQSTRQVGDITGTVKDLADQSNVLALNAAIEAARSGEAGRAFAVVARQMRSLADQSATATARVQTILADIGRAISEAVQTSEGGTREVEGGLEQARAAGESLRALAEVIQNNSVSVKSIADMVSQQDAGIAELFAALSDLTRLADETVERVATSAVAAARLTTASHEVSNIVEQYRL
ncbi:methyl-accepting chemotaxis protein [Corallococcus sp. AB011P]|uniref:methyl-accepting chemotaxis protein n=1 Tax=unclassified Corallococcus TaxID=2685029 RepID=UPI000EA0B878|nr:MULTISPECIES: methyl-accepting chemotaxis protein [unclassified Corallococcus]RKG53375.1 methyl-accepting chemotaxis protein [Corallococcus sp. AB011P]RKH90454.1 methyl-accepting chemotaxis protein [Corallococcus sp. AB045]